MTAHVGVTGAPRALTQKAPAVVRRSAGAALLVALGFALVAVGFDLAWRVGSGSGPSILARLCAAATMLLGGLAILLVGLERRRRDLPRRSPALVVLSVGLAVLYSGQVAGYGLTASWPGVFEVWVEAAPMILAAPLIIVGLISLTWPPGMTPRDLWFVSLDSVLAAMGQLVFWVLVIVPGQQPTDSTVENVFVGIDPWCQYFILLAVLVSASASRRTGALPVHQLILLQSSIGIYIVSDLVGDVTPLADRHSAITWSIVGYTLAAMVFWRFAIRPGLERDAPASTRLREVWAVTIPLLPVLFAVGALLTLRVTQGPLAPAVLTLAMVALLMLVFSNVVTRRYLLRDMKEFDNIPVALHEGTKTEWFSALVGDARDLVTVVDRNGVIVYQTPSVEALLGYSPPVLAGRSFADLLLDRGRGDITELLVRASHNVDDRGPHEFLMLDSNGARHYTETRIGPLRTGGSDGFVLTTRDVTDRRRLREALVESGMRDPLTGLLNREGFIGRLRDELSTAVPEGLAVGLIDIAGFRDLNDSLGHESGDEVLRSVAGIMERLPLDVRAVGRTGADEFGLVIRGDPVEPAVGETERELRESMTTLILSDGRPVNLKFALGYVTFLHGDEVASELLERADLALSAARTRSGGSVVRFEPGMRTALVTRLRAEAELRDALDESRLVVYYQPIVGLQDGAVESVEALVRMRSMDGSLVAPDEFIPLAEDLGLIHRIGETVLHRALRDRQVISQALGREISLSVNVSANQLDESLLNTVAAALAAAQTSPHRLVLELTETVLAENREVSQGLMSELRALGCALALDDFGTGFSSLSYLAQLPVDQLKIDGSFVGRLGSSSASFALVRMVLQLAQTLRLTTVAEGVETVEQADILRGMNCDRVQGFLYARPLSLSDLLGAIKLGHGLLPVA